MPVIRILLLSRYSRLGASSRVRSYQYLPYLACHGMQVTVLPLFGDTYLQDLYAGQRKRLGAICRAYLRRLGQLLQSRRFDLLWIEYELFPWLPAWGEGLLATLRIPYMVDYDDAIFHRYDMHPHRLVRMLLRGKVDTVMRRAALVLVGNEYLAERARRAGAKRVECLPTVVDVERYDQALCLAQGLCTIGWIGSPITAPYLALVQAVLSEVCQQGNVRVVIVGAQHVPLAGVPVETRPWSEQTEVQEIQRFDVGIMPLPDEPWERGKCGYKLIQYMACSKPAVASPVGVNRHIIADGIDGFLAATPTQWVQTLRTLCKDGALRERIGKAARRKVAKEYSLQVMAPRLVSLLSSVVHEGNKE
jgi:glycosyltransferase involved in cell wall biosynthesis